MPEGSAGPFPRRTRSSRSARHSARPGRNGWRPGAPSTATPRMCHGWSSAPSNCPPALPGVCGAAPSPASATRRACRSRRWSMPSSPWSTRPWSSAPGRGRAPGRKTAGVASLRQSPGGRIPAAGDQAPARRTRPGQSRPGQRLPAMPDPRLPRSPARAARRGAARSGGRRCSPSPGSARRTPPTSAVALSSLPPRRHGACRCARRCRTVSAWAWRCSAWCC